ncbi:MAG: hypothetical protein AABX93_00645 [Nanoarchaeota archaeon]
MVNLLRIIFGTALISSLSFGNTAKADHQTCKEFTERAVKYVKEFGSEMIDSPKTAYGEKGKISPDDYDKCIIENFEKAALGYGIEVNKRDPENSGGTTYKIVRKSQKRIKFNA